MAIKELFNDARPQVLFDPRASQRIDPRFKFTRAGVASYYDSQGILRYAPANQARLDYNTETGEVNGLLLEQQSTNHIAYSSGTTGYALANATYAQDATVIAPDGVSLANRLTSTVEAGSDAIFMRFGYAAFSDSIPKRQSVYLKAGTYNYARLSRTTAGNAYGSVRLNLATGEVVRNQAAALSEYAVTLTRLPNDWYRLEVVFPYNGLQCFTLYLTDYIDNSDFGAGTSLGNPGSGEYIYVWGCQFEDASKLDLVTSSYIPTAGSAVTRPADLLSIEGTPLPSTGSIYIDARSLSSAVDTTLLSAAPASPSTDKLALAIRQPANLFNSKALVYEVDGAFKPTLPFPVPTNARERNLITYGANNYHYRSDSARYTPSSSTSVPANMTRLGIGHDVTDPTKAMTGYINAVYLWPGEITPTVAEALVRGDVDPKDADAGVFTPAAGSLAFVFNTQGTSTDGNTVVQLPLRGNTNNVLVDWGDNTSSSLIGAAASVTVNHTYPSAGIYPVQIEADDDGTNSGLSALEFYNNSPLDLVRVLQWGGTTTFQPTTMYRIFRDCTQMDFLTAARTNLPDTSAVTDWREAFMNCTSITGQFPAFDTSAATTFSFTWYNCGGVTSYPQFDTSNVTRFERAWWNNTSLTSFPTIDTSSGTHFGGPSVGYGAWYNCNQLGSFPLLDFSSALTLAGAWARCSSLTSFPAINTASVTRFGEPNPSTGAWEGCSGLTSFPLIDTGAATGLARAWEGCSGLTSFPSINTSNCTDFYNTWKNCSSLTSFPALDFSSATNRLGGATSGDGTWRNCSSLTSFPFIDISGINGNIAGAWGGCSGLTSFPLLDFSNVTIFGEQNQGAWQQCTGLTSFPAINTSSAIRLQKAWYLCTGLTSFSFINTSNVTNMSAAWSGCSSLTSFPLIDTSQVTDMSGTWNACSSLTSFPSIDTSNVTTVVSDSADTRGAWSFCSTLTAFPALDLANCQIFGGNNGGAWFGCSGLTAFPSISFVAATTFWRCWQSCTSMVDFPAGLFDSWTGTPANNCFVLAWDNCTSLSATSVENILNSINTSGRSAPASGKDITIDYDAGSGTPNISTAVAALKSRGWTITLNNVAQ